MTTADAAQALSTARLIGLLGDVHGDMEHVLAAAQTMWARGVSALVVLGDFGFLWPGSSWSKDLDKLSKRLAKHGQLLFWVDGNHEDFAALYSKFPVSGDGTRPLRSNIVHLPRGYRTRLASGRTLAVLGGANSIDADHRAVGRSWWPEEQITDKDLTVLGHEQAEVMLGHDAPVPLPGLDAALAETDHFWPEEMLAYAAAGRRKFTTGFLQVRPSLYVGGHYHHFVDERVAYGEGEDAFEARVVLLSMNDPHSLSQAVLTVATLEVEAFARNNTTVTRLTGAEVGLWRVHTHDSVHEFDLDAGTVLRRPGPNAPVAEVESLRPLRTIDSCQVGKRGFWTFPAFDFLTDYYWHSSSTVEHIERIERKP